MKTTNGAGSPPPIPEEGERTGKRLQRMTKIAPLIGVIVSMEVRSLHDVTTVARRARTPRETWRVTLDSKPPMPASHREIRLTATVVAVSIGTVSTALIAANPDITLTAIILTAEPSLTTILIRVTPEISLTSFLYSHTSMDLNHTFLDSGGGTRSTANTTSPTKAITLMVTWTTAYTSRGGNATNAR